MPDTAARRIEDLTASECAALVAKLFADRADAANDDARPAPAPSYGAHGGQRGRARFRSRPDPVP